MKIAIACHPTQGGSGIVATEVALGMAERGHQVHMISCDRPFRLSVDSPVIYHKVNIPDYPLFKYPPHDLSLVNKLIDVVRKYHIDIIHAHYAVPHAICAIIAADIIQNSTLKTVATMHGTDITLVGSHPDYFQLCHYTMLRTDGLTTVSHWLKDRTVKTFDLERTPNVIYNFVDCSRFNPNHRVGYPENGDFLIMHASNFRPVKRTADVIRVFHQIQKQLPSSRLILAGNGPDLGLAKELCAELEICEKVEFAGSIRSIDALYKKSHLFLLLSDYESFGLSALEAQACGTPVIVSNSGGLREIVTDNVNGIRCPTGDIHTISNQAVALLKNPSIWEEMSKRSVKIVHQQFSKTAIIPKYENYYHQILEGTDAT